jgi:hypothetical protein
MDLYSPTAANEVTEEIIEEAYQIADGWYQGQRIEWDDLLDRLEGMEVNGKELDLGTDTLSPFIVKLKREVNKRRR